MSDEWARIREGVAGMRSTGHGTWTNAEPSPRPPCDSCTATVVLVTKEPPTKEVVAGRGGVLLVDEWAVHDYRVEHQPDCPEVRRQKRREGRGE